eukprot:TRINITY_DN33428_c0_g1_i1.p1 TRINITY_DN33428_c0_g1~~TRINITY_DN33428_c0_g1_i1.p1  ORF type:complete len:584 (+),score=125.65 TRINITY_DN33428_c0_g1_i1:70-1752(+)
MAEETTPQAVSPPSPPATTTTPGFPPGLNPNAATFFFNPQARPFVPVVAPASQTAPGEQPSGEPLPVAMGDVEDHTSSQEPADKEEERDEESGSSTGDLNEPLEELELDEEEQDTREHLNVVFIGHVDAGKSTLGGQILFQTGVVDERSVQKYEREARERNRESWFLAYVLDSNEEERSRGKTVEVGRAQFETQTKRYTILDAPGHKAFVPNMIGGAVQADVGVLVISARKGEFETGFERGGQTQEHTVLAKTLGVKKLICAISKMDDTTVNWERARYEEIVSKLVPFFKRIGYHLGKDLEFVPCSGLTGVNVVKQMNAREAAWWQGKTLIQLLDAMDPLERGGRKGIIRMPIVDKYKDMGSTWVMGKIESGAIREKSRLLIMPTKRIVEVLEIRGAEADDIAVQRARVGDNVKLRIRSNVEEEDIHPGFVLSDRQSLPKVVVEVIGQCQILDLLEHKPIFSAGYSAVFHIHCACEECMVSEVMFSVDPRTKQRKRAKYCKSNSLVICKIQLQNQTCIELFDEFPQLGRFTLRDEGKTIAVGKVLGYPGMPKKNTATASK